MKIVVMGDGGPYAPRYDENGRRLVDCDDRECPVYEEPHDDNIEELRMALDHWMNHSWLGGCSHGD